MDSAPAGETTSLQTSLNAITMILQRKMFAESKDEVALVLFGTDNTANDLADGDNYARIIVAKPLAAPSWDLLEYVQNDIQASHHTGDFIDALVVAVDHLRKATKGKRGIAGKRLILFSNLGGEFGDDKIDTIVGALKAEEVELNIIGPSLGDDDDDDGPPNAANANGHTKEKTPQQRAGETMVQHILSEVEGECYSFGEALPALSYFQAKAVKQTAWKCTLDIGADLRIPICMYTRVTEAKTKSMKKVYARDQDAAIQNERTFHLNDEAETEIEKDDTVQGHRYGKDLVPFSPEDIEGMKFQAEKCFKVLGMTKSENVKRHHYMGTSVYCCVGDKGDDAAAVALSALIQALYETNSVVIVRRVYANKGSPKLGFLSPHIKAKYECLMYSELPFMEDVRQFTFGSLPLSDDAPPAVQKYKPSAEQLELIDNLITDMDLTNVVEDDDGEKNEALKPKLTFNPFRQRLFQCLQHRALNPDEPLPELNPLIADYLKPATEVTTKCEGTVKKMKEKFKLEVVQVKKEVQTGQNVFKENDDDGPAAKKPKVEVAGGMADITKVMVTEVGTVTPVEDFRSIISAKDEDRFEEACKMMQTVIIKTIMASFGSQFFGKALDCLKALRQECVKNSEPNTFNHYLVILKETLKEKNKKDFWQEIVKDHLTLIDKSESEDSGVTKEEGAKFLEGEVKEEEPEEKEDEEDADDLLAMM
ncbi:X-ray repair cross-complementing protein 5-like isoform X2 [Lineus longissimus]